MKIRIYLLLYIFSNCLILNCMNVEKKIVFMDNKKNIWISDLSGEKYKPIIKPVPTFYGDPDIGSFLPELTPDESVMAYIDETGNLCMYNLENRSSKIVFDNKKKYIEDEYFVGLEILISRWLDNNNLLIYIDVELGFTGLYTGPYAEEIKKEYPFGYYIYNRTTNKVNYLSNLDEISWLIPNYDYIITVNSSNNYCFYNYLTNRAFENKQIDNIYDHLKGENVLLITKKGEKDYLYIYSKKEETYRQYSFIEKNVKSIKLMDLDNIIFIQKNGDANESQNNVIMKYNLTEKKLETILPIKEDILYLDIINKNIITIRLNAKEKYSSRYIVYDLQNKQIIASEEHDRIDFLENGFIYIDNSKFYYYDYNTKNRKLIYDDVWIIL